MTLDEIKVTMNLVTLSTDEVLKKVIPKLLPLAFKQLLQGTVSQRTEISHMLSHIILRIRRMDDFYIDIRKLLESCAQSYKAYLESLPERFYLSCSNTKKIFLTYLWRIIKLLQERANDETCVEAVEYIFSIYGDINRDLRHGIFMITLFLLSKLKVGSGFKQLRTQIMDIKDKSQTSINEIFYFDCYQFLLTPNDMNLDSKFGNISNIHFDYDWKINKGYFNLDYHQWVQLKITLVDFFSQLSILDKTPVYITLLAASFNYEAVISSPAKQAMHSIMPSLNFSSTFATSFLSLILSLEVGNHDTFQYISNLSTEYFFPYMVNQRRKYNTSNPGHPALVLEITESLSASSLCCQEIFLPITMLILDRLLELSTSHRVFLKSALRILDTIVNTTAPKLLSPHLQGILTNLHKLILHYLQTPQDDDVSLADIFRNFKSLVSKIDLTPEKELGNQISKDDVALLLIKSVIMLFDYLNELDPSNRERMQSLESDYLMALSSIRSTFTKSNFLFNSAVYQKNSQESNKQSSSLFTPDASLKSNILHTLIELLDKLFSPKFKPIVHKEALLWSTEVIEDTHPASIYYAILCSDSQNAEVAKMSKDIIEKHTSTKLNPSFNAMIEFISDRQISSDILGNWDISKPISNPHDNWIEYIHEDSLIHNSLGVDCRISFTKFLHKTLEAYKDEQQVKDTFLENPMNLTRSLMFIHPLIHIPGKENLSILGLQAYIQTVDTLFNICDTLGSTHPYLMCNIISYFISKMNTFISKSFYYQFLLNVSTYQILYEDAAALLSKAIIFCIQYGPKTDHFEFWKTTISHKLNDLYTQISSEGVHPNTTFGNLMALSSFLSSELPNNTELYEKIGEYILCYLDISCIYFIDNKKGNDSASFKKLFGISQEDSSKLKYASLVNIYSMHRQNILFVCSKCILSSFCDKRPLVNTLWGKSINSSPDEQGGMIQTLWKVADEILSKFNQTTTSEFHLTCANYLWDVICCFTEPKLISQHIKKLISLGSYKQDNLRCTIGLSLFHTLDNARCTPSQYQELGKEIVSEFLSYYSTSEDNDSSNNTHKTPKSKELALSVCVWFCGLLWHHPNLNAYYQHLAEIQKVFLSQMNSPVVLVGEACWRGLSRIHHCSFLMSKNSNYDKESDILGEPIPTQEVGLLLPETYNNNSKFTLLQWELLKTSTHAFVKKSHGDLTYSEYLQRQKESEQERELILDVLTDEGNAKRRIQTLRYFSEIAKQTKHWPVFLALLDQPLASMFTQGFYKKCLGLDTPTLGKHSSIMDLLCPKHLWKSLLIYIFHPNRRISSCIYTILKECLSAHTIEGIINHFEKDNPTSDLILTTFLNPLESSDPYLRESACHALEIVLPDKKWPQLESHFHRLWTSSLRAMDDLEPSVINTAIKMSNTLKQISLRFVASPNQNISQSCLEILIPLCQRQCETQGKGTISKFCSDLIYECVGASGKNIKPLLPQIIPFLIESLSGFEPDVMNQLQYHTESLIGISQQQLEEKRYYFSQTSPSSTLLQDLVKYMDSDILSKVSSRILQLAKNGLGVSTRGGALRFINWLTLQSEPKALDSTQAAKFFRGIIPCLFDHSAIIKTAASTLFVSLCGHNDPQLISKILCEDLLIPPPESAVEQKPRNAQRLVIGRLMTDISKEYSQKLNHTPAKARLVSMSYILSFSLDKEVSKSWKSLFDELAPIKTNTLKYYLSNVCKQCSVEVNSSFREDKIAASRAINDLCKNIESMNTFDLDDDPADRPIESVIEMYTQTSESIKRSQPYPGISQLVKSLIDLFNLLKPHMNSLITFGNPLEAAITICNKATYLDQSELLLMIDFNLSKIKELFTLDYELLENCLKKILFATTKDTDNNKIMLDLTFISAMNVWITCICLYKEDRHQHQHSNDFFTFEKLIMSLSEFIVNQSHEIKKIEIYDRLFTNLYNLAIPFSKLNIDIMYFTEVFKYLFQTLQKKKPHRRFKATLNSANSLIRFFQAISTDDQDEINFYKSLSNKLHQEMIFSVNLERLRFDNPFIDSSFFSLLYICVFLIEPFESHINDDNAYENKTTLEQLKVMNSKLLIIINEMKDEH